MKHKFNFYTQYHQFYLSDKESPNKTDSEHFWTENAYEERLAMEEGVIGIRTQCYGTVRGELDVLNHENVDIDSTKYDHIVEGGLKMTSDSLVILDCPNSKIEMQIKIDPGIYRVRVYSSNLNSVVDDEGEDYYKIEIWPDSNMGRKVLKRYDP